MLPDEDLKKPLRVQFVGEEGVDEGGLQKEYFQVTAQQRRCFLFSGVTSLGDEVPR